MGKSEEIARLVRDAGGVASAGQITEAGFLPGSISNGQFANKGEASQGRQIFETIHDAIKGGRRGFSHVAWMGPT